MQKLLKNLSLNIEENFHQYLKYLSFIKSITNQKLILFLYNLYGNLLLSEEPPKWLNLHLTNATLQSGHL